jgi:acyl carrier protein
MPAEAALGILGSLLASDTAQIAVAAVDWSALKAAYEARRERPLLEGLESKKAAAKESVENRAATLAEQVAALQPEERRPFLVDQVRGQVARVIGAPNPAALDIRQGLFEMGLDSLMSVELKTRLENSVGQALPSTLTFNYPTIVDLARYLDESVLAAVGAVPADEDLGERGQGADAAEVGPAVEGGELTEDDLAALLAAKLSKLK